jgi:hypothetical protein
MRWPAEADFAVRFTIKKMGLDDQQTVGDGHDQPVVLAFDVENDAPVLEVLALPYCAYVAQSSRLSCRDRSFARHTKWRDTVFRAILKRLHAKKNS